MQNSRDMVAYGIGLSPCILLLHVLVNVVCSQPITVPLYYDRMNSLYNAAFYIGTPPQKVMLMIDTGSGVNNFPCQDCCRCGNTTHYQTYQSSSYESDSCWFNSCYSGVKYIDGSRWIGYGSHDVMYVSDAFNNLTGFDSFSAFVPFSCVSSVAFDNLSPIPGVAGFKNVESTLPYQLYAQKVTTTKTFSLCFPDGLNVNVGLMTLGGTFSTYLPPPPSISYAKYIPITERNWYGVKLKDIIFQNTSSMARTPLHLPTKYISSSYGTYIDSGAMGFTFPKEFESIFISKLKELHLDYRSYGSNNFYTLKEKQLFPNMIVILEGLNHEDIEVVIDIDGLFFPWFGFYSLRLFFEDDRSILGSSLFVHNNVIFDIENDRIGFHSSSCNHNNLTSNRETSTRDNILMNKTPREKQSNPKTCLSADYEYYYRLAIRDTFYYFVVGFILGTLWVVFYRRGKWLYYKYWKYRNRRSSDSDDDETQYAIARPTNFGNQSYEMVSVNEV